MKNVLYFINFLIVVTWNLLFHVAVLSIYLDLGVFPKFTEFIKSFETHVLSDLIKCCCKILRHFNPFHHWSLSVELTEVFKHEWGSYSALFKNKSRNESPSCSFAKITLHGHSLQHIVCKNASDSNCMYLSNKKCKCVDSWSVMTVNRKLSYL